MLKKEIDVFEVQKVVDFKDSVREFLKSLLSTQRDVRNNYVIIIILLVDCVAVGIVCAQVKGYTAYACHYTHRLVVLCYW